LALTPGTRLGVYEVTAQIGEGGMGQVYRARDTKLHRDVALKVLPDSFANDPDRLARFTREAQTLASLNHPNIAHIHGFEEGLAEAGRGLADAGRGPAEAGHYVRALVMELVEGEDLSQRIARGAIPVDEALPIARQIAEALEAAHEQGIVHRDLKPANVKVRANGTVKVLDFGLAKALEPTGTTSASASMSPTLSLHATMAGVILGTAAYMAPEQAKGKSVDRRADVWAFGAVLYEMLAGKRAFAGDDISDTLVSVLRDEPDWAALPADVPASARQAMHVCLQKDPKQRVRDILAIRLALDEAFDAPPQQSGVIGGVPASRRALWRQVLPWAAGAFVVGALAAGTAVWLRPTAPPRVARFVITTPLDPALRLNLGSNSVVAMSPDGLRLVYRLTLGSGTNGGLYQRALGQMDAALMAGTEGAVGFFFSPDGNWIAFGSSLDNTLKRTAVSGGPPQTICALDGQLRGGSWGPDDTIVFATANSKGLRRVPAAGGEVEVLTKVDSARGETDHFWPEVLPDGRGVVFTAWNGTVERSRIVALSLPSASISEVVRGGSQPHLAPTGHLLYDVGGRLLAVQFDTGRLAVVGNPVPVMEGVASSAPTGAAPYAIAADGSLLYVRGTSTTGVGQRTLVWVNRKGQEEPIAAPPRAYTYARLSPDGTRVALDARDEQNDIWIWDFARQTLQRLTNDAGMNRSPAWTPDGKRVAFTAERDGVESVHWQAFDGSGTIERLSTGTQLEMPTAFSPDGTRLIFGTPGSPPYNLGVISLEATRTATMLLQSTADERNGEISPDGRWLAYESNESGRPEVYVRPFPNVDGARQLVSTGGGTRPLWSRNGSELFYYVAPDTIMALPVRLGAEVVLGNPQVGAKGPYSVAINAGRHYDVSADGQRFLVLKDAQAPDGQEPAAPEIHLVQHWVQELEAKLPAGR
jgi:serine/threonine-protein kinase